MEKRQLFVEGLHLRETQDGKQSRTVVGKAIVFNSRSEFLFLDDPRANEKEVILPEAISKEFLDTQDFVLTLWHNPEIVLGRSCKGQGTLKYTVTPDYVEFECEMPYTQHGDEALELVKRGDITGCSFIFSTDYFNTNNVEMHRETLEDGSPVNVYYVKKVDGVYDFTLTYRPAYPATDCSSRDLIKRLRENSQDIPLKDNKNTEEDMNITDEQLDAIAERVCKKLREMEESDKAEATNSNPEPETPAEAPKDETGAEAPADTESPKDETDRECGEEDCKDKEEQERSLKDIEAIDRLLNL